MNDMPNYTFSINQLLDALGDDDETKIRIVGSKTLFSQNRDTGELIISGCDPDLKEKLENAWRKWCNR